MAEMQAYRKTFPSALINRLVDCGFIVDVRYLGRDMAEPYRVSVKAGKREMGVRLMFREFSE